MKIVIKESTDEVVELIVAMPEVGWMRAANDESFYSALYDEQPKSDDGLQDPAPTQQNFAGEFNIVARGAGMTIEGPLGPEIWTVSFDFGKGDTYIDGRKLFANYGVPPWLLEPNMFDEPEFFIEIAALLPKKLDKALGPMRLYGNLFAIALYNRFRKYPHEFYLHFEQGRYIDHSDISAATQLPVYYSQLGRSWIATGLPRNDSLQRILFERPLLYGQVCRGYTLPFRSIAALEQLLSNNRANELLEFICSSAQSNIACRYLIAKHNEAGVLDFLMAANWRRPRNFFRAIEWLSPDEVAQFFEYQETIFDGLNLLTLSAQSVYRFLWNKKHPDRSFSDEYIYSAEQETLCRTVGHLHFKLPSSPCELLHAADRLDQVWELGHVAEDVPQRITVMLIEDKCRVLRGAVMLHNEKATPELCMRSHPAEPDSDSVCKAYKLWLNEFGLQDSQKLQVT